MAEQLIKETALPVSVLLAPTIIGPGYLCDLRTAGVDKVGIAMDLATPELFDRYRGSGVKGPHRWKTYWQTLGNALDVFGAPNAGVHLMVGMGETEAQMVSLMDELWQMGVSTHLFSFFAEENSQLSDRPQPPWPNYLRVQLARYLIETDKVRHGDMDFDDRGRIRDFGVDPRDLNVVIEEGTAFMTTGCLGPDGEVACNRPFGNCLPDVMQYNYPYPPNSEEISLIGERIFQYNDPPTRISFPGKPRAAAGK
jgi:biotin synthase